MGDNLHHAIVFAKCIKNHYVESIREKNAGKREKGKAWLESQKLYFNCIFKLLLCETQKDEDNLINGDPKAKKIIEELKNH